MKNVVPSVAIDKTDGCQIFLSFVSRSTQIVTSKCSELNVSFPQSEAEDADWVRARAIPSLLLSMRWGVTPVSVCLLRLLQTELPIPEQFVSVVRDGRLHTTVSDLYSA